MKTLLILSFVFFITASGIYGGITLQNLSYSTLLFFEPHQRAAFAIINARDSQVVLTDKMFNRIDVVLLVPGINHMNILYSELFGLEIEDNAVLTFSVEFSEIAFGVSLRKLIVRHDQREYSFNINNE